MIPPSRDMPILPNPIFESQVRFSPAQRRVKISVEYITEEEAQFGTYYDSIRQKFGGELPFVVNPNDLSKEELLDPNSKVRSELGDDYDYNVPAHKVLHDIHVGRLRADEKDSRRNFGMKQWFMVSPETNGIVIDIIRAVEGSATLRMAVTENVLFTKFTGAQDIETGLLGQILRDS